MIHFHIFAFTYYNIVQSIIKSKYNSVGMQLLSRMNAKMDLGYKLTNYYCQFCSGVTMAKPNADNKEGMVYCPKCEKQYAMPQSQDDDDEYMEEIVSKSAEKFQQLKAQPEPQQGQDSTEQQYNEFLAYYNSSVKTAQQAKSQEVSKKMGQKLITGWAMLDQSCLSCNVPLMGNKKGNMVCCGCDKDYANEKNQGQQKEKKDVKQKSQQQKKEQAAKFQQLEKGKEKQSQPQSQTQQPIRHIKIHPHGPKQIQENNVSKSEHHSHTAYRHSSQSLQKIQAISLKTLNYLQGRLQKSFEMNDLESVERVLKLIKSVKELQ